MAPVESVIDLGEFRLNVARAGRGDPLVLLHGSDPRENWRVWAPMTSLLDGFDLIMPDLVGYGSSSRPLETPAYDVQARVVSELLERLGVRRAGFVGASWGGQVALEVAIKHPETVASLVLLSSTYDKSQVPELHRLGIPTLILWAEDDMVTQTKAGYLLRDAIRTSRLEVLEPVAKDPRLEFTVAHKLERYRSEAVRTRVIRFLASPGDLISEPPELEKELKGMALKEADRKRADSEHEA